MFFYKRAQILVADIWGAFGGQGPGALRGMDRLTMFADYRVPQQLRAMGILLYTPALAEKVPRRPAVLGNAAAQQGAAFEEAAGLVQCPCLAPIHAVAVLLELGRLISAQCLSLPTPLNSPSNPFPSPRPFNAPLHTPQVSSQQEIPAGSEEEVEIRAATVQAVEMMHAALAPSHAGITRVALDWLLWTAGERNERALPPHHRTLTCYY